MDSSTNGENKDSMLDGEARGNGGGGIEDGSAPTRDQSTTTATARDVKNNTASNDGSIDGKEDEDEDDDDEIILKQILQESLADNYGQETYSVEYDDDDENTTTITTSSLGPDDVILKTKKKRRRIVELTIGTTLSAPFDHHWDLSPRIHRLGALRKLSVTSCRSLPEEIGMMKNLRFLTLIACKRMENFPSAFSSSPSDRFQHQEQECHGTNDQNDTCGKSKLQIEEFRILGIIPLIPPFLLSRLSGLSKLRVLQYSFHALARDEELEYVHALTSSKNPFMISNGSSSSSSPVYSRYAFESTLEELILNRCHLSTRGMELLVTDVVPHYPKMKVLSLCKNNIRSLRGLVDTATTTTTTTTTVSTPMSTNGSSTKTDTETPPYRSKFTITKLEELILSDNPIWHGPLPSFISPYEDSDDENDEGGTGEGDGLDGNNNHNQQGNPQQQQQQQREAQLLTPSEVRRRHDEQKEKIIRIQEQEQKNLEQLLVERAPFMSYLGFRFEKSKLWTPTVQHWLDVNRSCRKLLFADQEEEKKRLQAISAKKQRVGPASGTKDDVATNSSSTFNDDDEEEESNNALLPLVIDRTFRHFRKTDTIFGKLYGTQRFRMSPEMRSSNVVYYALRNSSVFLHPQDHDQDHDQKS
mmetsp:Transcript_18772/g.45337  ORF Transcript_18772/g.45337 Transcript_18772/m.45337 type:complete len:642 (-) Transcript_18772:42-1967(-)